MKRVICFSRVSTSTQDLQAQREEVKGAALRDKFKESEIIEVSGKESAIKLDEEERQTLNEMKQLVEEYPSIEAIYFFAVDRCARRMSIVTSVAEWAEKNKINLVFLRPYRLETMMINETGVRVSNPMTTMILGMMAFAAQMEMNAKNARFQTAKKWRRKNGKVTGKLLLGYKPDKDGNITIDTDGTAKIVHWVFDCYLNKNMSTPQIYDEGVALGYFNDTCKTNTRAGNIRDILRNKRYCGEPTPKGQVYPTLIDEETIDRAIAKMRDNFFGEKKYTKHILYCKGKMFDSNGYSMSGDYSHRVYISTQKNVVVNINVADFLCWRVAYFAKWNMMTMEKSTQIEDTQKQIDEVGTKLFNIKERIRTEIEPQYSKAYEGYVNSRGRVTLEMYNTQIDDLDRQHKRLQKQVEELEKRESELSMMMTELKNKEERDINIYDIMSIESDQQRKEIIDEVIEKIIVEKIGKTYKFKIYYPLMTSPSIFLYCQHGGVKKEIYELLEKDGQELYRTDISTEFIPRFTTSLWGTKAKKLGATEV